MLERAAGLFVCKNMLTRPPRLTHKPNQVRGVRGIPIPLPVIQVDGAAANRARFQLPEDGCFQVLRLGEFAHKDVGIQVIDGEALNRIKADFDKLKGPNWTGMLVDRDHFSHDPKLPTDALAWVDDVEIRGDGLWAKGRWTSVGQDVVEGGILRLTSPVLEDFEDLGNGKKRPGRMTRIALTNDPNIKGMTPISNRGSNMDYKKALCRMLDLPETATDAEIETAANKAHEAKSVPPPELVAIKNRLATTESGAAIVKQERDTLKAENERLRGDVAEQDLERLGTAVKNRDELKKRLVEDRDGTLALLKAAGVETKTVPKPVHNRSGRNPGNPDTDDKDAFATPEHATRVSARANEIMAKNRLPAAEAFQMADRELRAAAVGK